MPHFKTGAIHEFTAMIREVQENDGRALQQRWKRGTS
jgi:hypothetical protein